jgi:hypothetical protein
MKKIFYLFLVLLLFSCEKESKFASDTYKNNFILEKDSKSISRWGKFLVIGGTMFINNHETGEMIKFSHFDSLKTVSSLRWGGPYFDIETIEKDKTTYSFYKPINYPGNGRLIINDDSTKHYMVNYMGMNTTIIEDPIHGMTEQLLGGSSRPYTLYVIDYENKILGLRINQIECSIDGYNCNTWNEIKLKKIEEW